VESFLCESCTQTNFSPPDASKGKVVETLSIQTESEDSETTHLENPVLQTDITQPDGSKSNYGEDHGHEMVFSSLKARKKSHIDIMDTLETEPTKPSLDGSERRHIEIMGNHARALESLPNGGKNNDLTTVSAEIQYHIADTDREFRDVICELPDEDIFVDALSPSDETCKNILKLCKKMF
jgi:hypothetical protein